MADEKKEEGGGNHPINDLYFLLGLIFIMALLWFVTGGPGKGATTRGLFMPGPVITNPTVPIPQ